MLETGAILLAAGLSRRMGDRNKLLLPIGEIPMIRHMVMTYHTATKSPICVVVGHQEDLIAEGTVVSRGGVLTIVDAVARDASGRLVAKCQATYKLDLARDRRLAAQD